jgi:hypothetical protein
MPYRVGEVLIRRNTSWPNGTLNTDTMRIRISWRRRQFLMYVDSGAEKPVVGGLSMGLSSAHGSDEKEEVDMHIRVEVAKLSG